MLARGEAQQWSFLSAQQSPYWAHWSSHQHWPAFWLHLLKQLVGLGSARVV